MSFCLIALVRMRTSPHTGRSRVRACLFAIAAVIAISSASPLSGQAVKTASTPPPELSRFDLYAGYGYLHPVNSDIFNVVYQPLNPGAVVSGAAYFNTHFGVQAETSIFPNGPNDCIDTAQVGPIFRLQRGRFVPFAHALVGAARVGGPSLQPCTWGWGVTSGVGTDYVLPFWNNHLAVRPIEADFSYSHVNFGPPNPDALSGGLGQVFAYRLSAGVVLRLGEVAPPPPIQLGCTAEPANVYPGDPIMVTGTAANLNLKRKATYTWSASGGQISGTEATANLSTAGLAPGDYTISGHLSEGPRAGQQASCTAGFRVHDFEPPVVSCSANPSTVVPGDNSTITTTASSPQNRTLSYSYSTSAGQVTGNTPTATLTTAGATDGPITITCNVVDDKGKQTSATTVVTVTAPPPPPAPKARALCSVSFERDRKRPVRVDNEAKGCLDEISLTLNRDTTSKLVLVGKHSADESPDVAAQRVLNVEQYLTEEKGVDPSRIELRTTGEPGRSLDSTLVPVGATFIPGDTSTIDINSVKHQAQPYAKPKAGKTR